MSDLAERGTATVDALARDTHYVVRRLLRD
jgi:hypothetical protein